MATLSTVVYLIVIVLPFVVAVIVSRMVRSHRSLQWSIGVPFAVVVILSLILGRQVISTLADRLGAGAFQYAPTLFSNLLFSVTGGLWAWFRILASHRGRFVCRIADWVALHRKLFTIIAALWSPDGRCWEAKLLRNPRSGCRASCSQAAGG
ncbi:hypothetical protein [Brevibacterium siliguriense]|nr:hypothetical protein [Brevibacterium siliguriense]